MPTRSPQVRAAPRQSRTRQYHGGLAGTGLALWAASRIRGYPPSIPEIGAAVGLAEIITRAQNGTPTVVTRNGQAVAAVVSIEDFGALENAIGRYFSREADRDLAENPDAATCSMSQVAAAIFEEDKLRAPRLRS